MPAMRAIQRSALAGLLGLAAGGVQPAAAATWELGVGAGAASFSEYRGSNERSEFVVPVPYLSYRGERLRIGREGARGLLAETPDYEIDVSVDGAVPVESSDDGPRAGMEELDPVIELGPSVNWRLGENAWGRWRFHLPLRAAVATDLQSIRQVGWTLNPSLRLFARELLGGWDFRFTTGPLVGSRNFHRYYYDVDPADVRPGRPTFDADPGYSGYTFRVSAARRLGRVWAGAFLRYDNLAGAAFVDSPLVETRHATSLGFAVSWVFRESRRR